MKRREPGNDPARFWEDEAFLRDDAAIPRRPRRSRRTTYGDARLARASDLAHVLRPSGDPHDTHLHHFTPLVESDDDIGLAPLFLRELTLTEELLSRHLLLVGQTGCGKTQRAILPLIASQLRDPARSMVVFDVKGELYEPIDELARRAGRAPRDVLRLDLTQPDRTVGWNPLGPDPDPSRTFDLAHQVCRATEKRGANDSAFWLQTSTDLVAGILEGLARDAAEIASLARVREVLNLPWGRFKAWVDGHRDAPSLLRFAEFLSTGSHNAHTALADASNRLLVFLDRALSAVTSHHELDLDLLVDRPLVLVVVVPESHIERLRPLFNILVQQVVDTLLRRADRFPQCRLPRPVTLFLDEFASALGRLPDLEVRLNTLRSRRVSLVAAVQGLSQLEHVYGSASGPLLAGFGSKVFFSDLEVADALYASRLSGETTVDETHVTERWDDEASQFAPASRSRVPIARPLLLPGEIASRQRHFELGELSTWFVSGLPPFQAWTMPAWRTEETGPVLAAARRGELAPRGVRRRPLGVVERGEGDGPSVRFLRSRLRALEARIGLDRATRRARDRWAALRRDHFDEPEALIELARELQTRDVDVDEYSMASDRCGSTNPKAVLHFLDFEREARTGRARPIGTGRLPFPDDVFAHVEDDADGAYDGVPDDVPF